MSILYVIRGRLPVVRQLYESSFRERLHWHATCGTVSEWNPDRRGRLLSAKKYARLILTISAVYMGLVVAAIGAMVMAMRQ